MSCPSYFDLLSDDELLLIFDQLPLVHLRTVGLICHRWHDLLLIAHHRRQSLHLQWRDGEYLFAQKLYRQFGLTFDTLNHLPLNCKLSLKLLDHLTSLYPNIDRLELIFSKGDCTVWLFLRLLLDTVAWRGKLRHVKLIINETTLPLTGETVSSKNELVCLLLTRGDISFVNHFMALSHLQNEAHQSTLWNCYLEQIVKWYRFSLESLTLYSKGDITGLVCMDSIRRLTSLRSLTYGLRSFNQLEVCTVLSKLTHLRHFSLLSIHHGRENRPEEIYRPFPGQDLIVSSIDRTIANQISTLTFIYSETTPLITKFLGQICNRFLSITHLHLRLNSDSTFATLYPHLARLNHLTSLRLARCSEQFFTTDLPNLEVVPPFGLITQLHLELAKEPKLEEIKPKVSILFPNLARLTLSCDVLWRGPRDYIKPTGQKLHHHLLLSASKALPIDSLEAYLCRITATHDPTTEPPITYLQLPMFTFSNLAQLFPVLSRFESLTCLRFHCTPSMFSDMRSIGRHQLAQLKTLHLERRRQPDQTVDTLALDNFSQTAAIWPNLGKLKLDGIRVTLHVFSLSPTDLGWLQSLGDSFAKLTRIYLLINCCDNKSERFRRSASNRVIHCFDPKGTSTSSRRSLTLIQQAFPLKQQ